MSQEYSNPKRASSPYSLPDVEIFKAHYADCPECGNTVQSWDCQTGACQDDGRIVQLTESGYFWWTCLPGCLPDSEPCGPFATYAEALADAREGMEDDEEEDDDSVTA